MEKADVPGANALFAHGFPGFWIGVTELFPEAVSHVSETGAGNGSERSNASCQFGAGDTLPALDRAPVVPDQMYWARRAEFVQHPQQVPFELLQAVFPKETGLGGVTAEIGRASCRERV